MLYLESEFYYYFTLLFMPERGFHLDISQSISENFLNECDCSLLSHYFESSKQTLYPYFICECIKPFLLKSFNLYTG